MKNIKAKKVVNVIFNVLLYVFLAICIFSIIITVLAKKDSDGAAQIFGYQMRIVSSDSMEKCELTDVSDYKIKSLPLRSLLFIELVPEDKEEAYEWYSELEVGDVLTFRYLYANQVTITHRITDIEEKAGGYIISLEGDNKNSESNLMTQVIDTTKTDSPNYVIGKVTGQFLPLGFVISLIQTPLGIIFIVIVPCFIIILLEIIKIISVVNADKKKKLQEESAKKDDELEALKRRLAELEKQSESAAEEKNADEAPTEETADEMATAEEKPDTADETPAETDGDKEQSDKADGE